MLAQVDPATFGQNIYLLIGALVALGFLFVMAVAACTLAKVLIWRHLKRRDADEVARRTRRADGTLYPPFVAAVCEACGRADRRVVCPPTGKLLCQACFEARYPAAPPKPQNPSRRRRPLPSTG